MFLPFILITTNVLQFVFAFSATKFIIIQNSDPVKDTGLEVIVGFLLTHIYLTLLIYH